MDNNKIINKTMDLDDLKSDEALVIIEELNNLINKLRQMGLKISSWYGNFNLRGDRNSIEWKNRGYGYKSLEGSPDDNNFPWFLYWEIAWVVLNNEFKPEHHVLDLGGSSSLFSYYLASKGIKVTTIDLQSELVENANFVAKEQGWELNNYLMDIRDFKFENKFDHITSICVYEHIPLYDRIAISKRIKEYLVEGGKFSLTFDYKNPSRFAKIHSQNDIQIQMIEPSGLKIRGNSKFFDNGKRYLLNPFYCERRFGNYKVKISRGTKTIVSIQIKEQDTNEYTFGSLFLEKEYE